MSNLNSKKIAKLLLTLGITFFSHFSLASLSISPNPVSGSINLDSQSSTIYFSNPTSSSISMNLALSGTGFSLGIDRCSGKNLAPKTSCYIVVNVKDSLLSVGSNSASLNNNSNLLVSFSRTKIQNSSPSIFTISSLSVNDFLTKEILIKNQTSTTRSYSPTLSGTDASKYEIVSNRCQNIVSGKSCAISLKLKPQQVGSYSASLSEPQISSSVSISSSITGSVSGVLSPPVSSVSVSPLSLDFGDLTKFTPSQGKVITITNNGNQDITPIISLSSKMTMLANRCSSSLAVGKSCAIFVAMNPIYQTDVNGLFTGTVSVQASISSTISIVEATSNLKVPPASVAYKGQGGTCPSGKHFENNVCVNDTIVSGPISCQEVKDTTPSSPSGYYDLSTLSGTINVYCDMSDPSNAYMEIFDLTREPMLTDADIVQRLNRFSNYAITTNNILRDGNGSVAWTQDATNLNLINGQPIGLDKIVSEKMKFSAQMSTSRSMGTVILQDTYQYDCSADTNNLINGCYQNAYKVSGNARFIMADFGTGAVQMSIFDNGIYSNIPFPYLVEDYIVDNLPASVYLTQTGRYEGGVYQSPYFYFKKLLIKGSVSVPLTYASCSAAKSAGVTTSGYVSLDSDGPTNNTVLPSKTYCDMSGAGVATISQSCNYARIFGQKNSSNNTGSGVYQIDLDGPESNFSQSDQYCDMTPTAWNNNEGGYTLAGIFTSDATISQVQNVQDISSINNYMNNPSYQKLLSTSKEIILRSNRGDSTEVLFRVMKYNFPLINCSAEDSTLVQNSTSGGNSSTSTNFMSLWFWGEPDCNLSNGDYSMIGIRSDIGNYYLLYNLAPSSTWLTHYNWNSSSWIYNNFTTTSNYSPEYTAYNIIHIPRYGNEPIYIFLK